MLPSYLGWLLSCKKKKHTISTSSSLRCFKHLSCFTSIENQYFSCAVFSLAERKSICVVPWRVYCKDSDHVGYSAAGVLFWLVVDKTFQVSSDFLIWANICWNILNARLLCDIKNCNAVRLISKTIYNVLFHSKDILYVIRINNYMAVCHYVRLPHPLYCRKKSFGISINLSSLQSAFGMYSQNSFF